MRLEKPCCSDWYLVLETPGSVEKPSVAESRCVGFAAPLLLRLRRDRWSPWTELSSLARVGRFVSALARAGASGPVAFAGFGFVGLALALAGASGTVAATRACAIERALKRFGRTSRNHRTCTTCCWG